MIRILKRMPKEEIVLNKKRGRKIIISIFIILAAYYIYALCVTNGVMETARKVAAGEIIVESGTPYAIFSPLGENIYKCDITRYFVYCGINKGKIFVTCVLVIISDDGEVQKARDWFEILIEKTDEGEWEAVGIIWQA